MSKQTCMESCQLCGSCEDVSPLDGEFVSIVSKLCELTLSDDISACIECNIFLYQIQVFIKKVHQAIEVLPQVTHLQDLDEEKDLEEEENNQSLNGYDDESVHQNDLNTEEILIEENETIIEETVIDDQMESDNDSCRDSSEQSVNQDFDSKGITSTAFGTEKIYIFKCHICDAPEFNKMSQLSVHTRSEHKSLPMVKCSCDKLLSTMRALERHQAKHFPKPSDFRCSKCSVTFKTLRGLDNHDRRHEQDIESFICSLCGKSFRERKTLEHHEVTHAIPPELRRNFQCSECSKLFISADAMRNHYANHHEQVLSFFCEVCRKGFYTRKSLISHEKIHKPSEEVFCDLCNGTFKSLKYMQKHRKSHFLPSQNSFLICDICQKQFRKKSQMKSHMLIHNDVAEHFCDICSKTFKKKCYLKAHLVTHTGERNFHCSFCDRSFADSGNCRKHKLKDHPEELAAHEAKYGKKGVSNAVFMDY